jgi:hypothetical protein
MSDPRGVRLPSVAEPVNPRNEEALGSGANRIVNAALVVVAAAAIVGWLFLALSHMDDRYGVLHVQGAWMGLAQEANDGVLYPPLSAGGYYGGTRWMPLPILLNALAGRITGEFLTSGKVVGMLLTLGLLILAYGTLRRLETPRALAGALTGTIVATDPGRIAGTTLGGDVLPVVLQVGALLVATTSRRKHSLAVAGVLAGLAFASKVTGVWAALALVTWLGVHRRWRDVGLFGGAFGATIVVVLGTVELVSGGRFSDDMLLLTFAGVGGGVGPIRAPNQLLYQFANFGLAVWVLVPFVAAGVILAKHLRRLSVYHFAIGWALLLLLVIYTDVGAGANQLLDVTVLTALAAGNFAARLETTDPRSPMAIVLAVAVVWGTGSGVVLDLVPDVRRTVEGARLGYPLHPLTGRIGPRDEFLSEDPYVPLSLGRKPVVLDPFMLRRLDLVDPEAVDDLIGRIERQEFAYIATIEPLNAEDGPVAAADEGEKWANDYWWDQFHFGLRVVTAMRRMYVLEGIVDEYYLYRPAP